MASLVGFIPKGATSSSGANLGYHIVILCVSETSTKFQTLSHLLSPVLDSHFQLFLIINLEIIWNWTYPRWHFTFYFPSHSTTSYHRVKKTQIYMITFEILLLKPLDPKFGWLYLGYLSLLLLHLHCLLCSFGFIKPVEKSTVIIFKLIHQMWDFYS